MMISKRTSTKLVDEMINFDMDEIAADMIEECKAKWQQRKNSEEIEPHIQIEKKINLLRGVPNTWCELINTQMRQCPKWRQPGRICTSWHMKYAHREEIKPVLKLWREEISPIIEEMKKQPRGKIKQKIEPIIEKHLKIFEEIKTRICVTGC